MAFNPAALSKSKMPAPGGDPMLDEEISMDEEMGAPEESPFAALSDEEFLMEAEKRGLQVSMPEMEEDMEGAEDLGMEDDEMCA